MSLLQFEIRILMVAAFLAGVIAVWSFTGNKKSF
jgi:hypothetical protein